MGDHQVARVGESNVDSRRSNFTHDLKRFGLFAAPIIAGLSMAGIAYQLVALIAVQVTSAETVGDLHTGWFLIRAMVAYRAAKLSGRWVHGVFSRK